jgi:hypothetical protein
VGIQRKVVLTDKFTGEKLLSKELISMEECFQG